MGIINFYWQVLLRSVTDGIGLSQTVIFLLVVAVGLLSPRLRAAQKIHEAITSGRFAVLILIALIIVRVPSTIYNMWHQENALRLIAECQ
jgi:hypothetical protein